MPLRLLRVRLHLALSLWRRKIGRVLFFWKSKRAKGAFLAPYRSDAIFALGSEEVRARGELGKCQMCSLCTFSCQAIAEGRAPADFEPKFLAGIVSKTGRYRLFYSGDLLPCAQCSVCTVLCPTGVPIHDIKKLALEGTVL